MGKVIDPNHLARNCVDCVYHCKIYHWVVCDYLEKVGHPRPCPHGDACTVKIPFKRRSYPANGKKVSE